MGFRVWDFGIKDIYAFLDLGFRVLRLGLGSV